MDMLILLTVALAAVIAQFVKLFLDLFFFRHKVSLREIFVTGGMPSAHVSTVVSLATIIFLVEGLSTAFVIALVLAVIVVRDAVGVRYSVGKEGEAINQIIAKLRLKIPRQDYAFGHRPVEAFVGVVIGIVVAFGMYWVFV